MPPAAASARLLRQDMTARFDAADRIDNVLANEPTESSDAAEPMLPIDSTEPMLPIESAEFAEQIDSTELRER